MADVRDVAVVLDLCFDSGLQKGALRIDIVKGRFSLGQQVSTECFLTECGLLLAGRCSCAGRMCANEGRVVNGGHIVTETGE